MKVLVACEFSGIVRNAFTRKGHLAFSCDIIDTISKPGFHYIGDVRDILYKLDWDLVIAHPPCTYLANSGVYHLHRDKSRFKKMEESVEFFNIFLNLDHVQKVCIENPIPHKYGIKTKYDQIIQPYQFGHLESKATCLWLKNLPKLKETNNVYDKMVNLPKRKKYANHYMGNKKYRGRLRSITYINIAKAMAEQWG